MFTKTVHLLFVKLLTSRHFQIFFRFVVTLLCFPLPPLSSIQGLNHRHHNCSHQHRTGHHHHHPHHSHHHHHHCQNHVSGFSVRVCLVNPGNVRTMERQEIPDVREQPRNLISGLVVIGDGFTERHNSNAGFARSCQ